jgi:mRNA-degrading endonuclease RelE of RelBE toxin-antitoxin system
MWFEIVVAPEAARALRGLPARHRAEVRDALETHLRHEPAKVSKSRIKRLRGMAKPQYRLRVGETRVFYDVTDEAVEVVAIVAKRQAQAWLADRGTPEPEGGPGEGEG